MSRAPVDPWRRLATACAVLTVSAHHTPEQWARAKAAYDDCQTLSIKDGLIPAVSERFLREAFYTVERLGLESKQARDALWAAVKLFGHCRSAQHRIPAREADATYWWQERE